MLQMSFIMKILFIKKEKSIQIIKKIFLIIMKMKLIKNQMKNLIMKQMSNILNVLLRWKMKLLIR